MEYTRQQIIEALDFWKKLLEHTSCNSDNIGNFLLDAVDLYGKDIVFSKNNIFNPDVNQIKDLFELINLHVFNSKNEIVDIELLQFNDINKYLNYNLNNDFYGLYHVMALDEKLKSFNDELEYTDKKIFLNKDNLKDTNFIFFASVLCHEMIHEYNKTYGEEQICDKYEIFYKIKIDAHTTPTFINMKRKANNTGLTVIDNSNGLNFSELNSEAFTNMLNRIINDGTNINENKISAFNDLLIERIPGKGTLIVNID